MTNHLEVDSAAFHLVLSIKQHGAVRLHLEKYVMYLGWYVCTVCVVTAQNAGLPEGHWDIRTGPHQGLTLSQPVGGADYAHPILMSPPSF